MPAAVCLNGIVMCWTNMVDKYGELTMTSDKVDTPTIHAAAVAHTDKYGTVLRETLCYAYLQIDATKTQRH